MIKNNDGINVKPVLYGDETFMSSNLVCIIPLYLVAHFLNFNKPSKVRWIPTWSMFEVLWSHYEHYNYNLEKAHLSIYYIKCIHFCNK